MVEFMHTATQPLPNKSGAQATRQKLNPGIASGFFAFNRHCWHNPAMISEIGSKSRKVTIYENHVNPSVQFHFYTEKYTFSIVLKIMFCVIEITEVVILVTQNIICD